jgi:hypothetical protein
VTQYALLFVVGPKVNIGGSDEWRTVQVASSRLLVNVLIFVVVFRRPYTQIPMPYF